MEPLSALAIVNSIVQFLDFMTRVVSTGLEISKSSTGASRENERLEEIIVQLRELSASLACRPSSSLREQGYQTTLEDLSMMSKIDCDDLLKALNGLKVSDGKPSIGKSLSAAFKARMKESDVSSMKFRIAARQQTITLHIVTVVKYVTVQKQK